MPDSVEKCFVNSFLQFLKKQTSEGKFTSDLIESLEVAIQCLEAVYEINLDDESRGHVEDSDIALEGAVGAVGTNQLSDIDLFEMFQSVYIDKNPEKQKEAEEIKNEGNNCMKEGKFYEALLLYNKAIRLDPKNPVFYCNRAAAYTRLNEFSKAIADCKMALSYNPNYSKAYGRMGVAYSNLEKHAEASEAYKKALELEPDNQDYQNNLRLFEQNASNNFESYSNIINNQINSPELRDLFNKVWGNPDLANMFNKMAEKAMADDPNMERLLHSLDENPDLIERLLNIKRQPTQLNQQHHVTNSEDNVAGPSRQINESNVNTTTNTTQSNSKSTKDSSDQSSDNNFQVNEEDPNKLI